MVLSFRTFRLFFILLVIFLFLGMPIMSLDHGTTWDERFQHEYAKRLVDYYTSFGEDRAALDYSNLHLYGGLFEVFAGFADEMINPYFEKDYTYKIRHVLNSLTGFLAILFTGLLGRYLGGWRAGFLAMVLIVLSPRFLGHSMNNPKDIPFAAFYIMSIYFMIKVLREFPTPTKRSLVLLILGIACAINIRVGGLLLIAYFIFFTGIEVVKRFYLGEISKPEKWYNIKKALFLIITVSIFSYLGGLIFWPYGHHIPFHNPFVALQEMSQFKYGVNMLFEGEVINSKNAPWYYILKYLAITTPLVVLAGLILFFGWLIFKCKISKHSEHLMVLFAVIFPLGYILYKDSNLYDGIRQVLFVYPSMIVLAGLSITYLYNYIHKKSLKFTVIAALAGLLILPLSHIIRNYPNEYVYFNRLVGGVKGAYGDYELDYWASSSGVALNKLGRHLREKLPRDSVITVASNFLPYPDHILSHYDIKVNYVDPRYKDRYSEDWDYGVFVGRLSKAEYYENGKWPPKDTLFTVRVDGKPIMAVEKYNKGRK